MRLSLVDRYILREVLQTWGAVTAVLVLILVTNSLAYMLGKVVEGQLAGDAVLPLFLTNVTGYFVTLIPLGLYLGLLLVFGRLYAESEMAALGACGVGFARLYRPVMIAAVLAATITAALTVWVSPWANRVEHEIEARMAARSELAGVAPGRFNRASGGRLVLFTEDRRDDVLREVFVEAEDAQGDTHLVRARTAAQRVDPATGWHFLEFREGYRYTGTPGSAGFRVIEFQRHGVRVPTPSIQPGEVGRDGHGIAQLWRSGKPADMAELQWRLSLPLACILLAFAAVPLAHTTPRQGRYGKIAIALLIYLVYSNVLVLARDWLASGMVSAVVGMWWAHGLTIAFVAALVTHRVGWQWTRRVLTARTGVAP